ncbi:MAG: acetyl-CoA carboxylase, carboxyltransferase subunit beta [Elusimicrobiota bacterium]|jgi:acetyl-CoA carboxylase carboxyl transferase subunit beta|nr:acetyl-CoA carboxylase, carboxyltransferase subunit beta [Elusimicrobiota bacterium]
MARKTNQSSGAAEDKISSNKLWMKCPQCDQILLLRDFENNFFVCPKCSYYARVNPRQRISITVDENSFEPIEADINSVDFLKFPGYSEKLKKQTEDSVVIGKAKIKDYPIVIAVMDFGFMGGSMGSVVGEKIVRAVETALSEKIPLLIVSASGGARMQEGIVSLMQMAKTSAALAKLSDARIAYISLLTNPTTGGVAASFAMLGDINIAETGALVGFAGPRVIEQTIRQQLPDGFQRPEFLRNHGAVDLIVERKNMKDTIANLLRFFCD